MIKKNVKRDLENIIKTSSSPNSSVWGYFITGYLTEGLRGYYNLSIQEASEIEDIIYKFVVLGIKLPYKLEEGEDNELE